MKKLLLIFIFCLAGVGVFYAYKVTKPLYAKVPIYYLSENVPMLNIEIGLRSYSVALDTGASEFLALQERVLDEFPEKQEFGIWKSLDINGLEHKDPYYLLPKMRISNFKISPMPTILENTSFLSQGSFISEPHPEFVEKRIQEIDGRLGMGLFHKACLFIDLPNSIVYIAKNASALQKEKSFSLEGFIEVPIVSDTLPILAIDMPLGTKRLLLDSGAVVSIWNDTTCSSLTSLTQALNSGKKEIGVQEFLTYQIPKEFGADGFLGVDFLKKHAVFIDMQNKKAYIAPECSK